MSLFISLTLVGLVIMGMGGAIILLWGDRSTMKHKLEYIKSNREYIMDSIMKLSSRQHEFQNHIAVLGSLPSVCENYDELTSRIEKYTNTLTVTRNEGILIGQLDNKYLAAFLCEKLRQAQDKGINFTLDIKNTDFEIEDEDLIEVLGTLIDNAFDSLTNAKPEDRFMSLYMGLRRIEVKNRLTSTESVDIGRVFDSGFSTKNNSGRGLGLYNARQIMKGNGVLEAEVLNETSEMVFRAFVI
jgi:two-component system sensor histidine kinase DctS